MASRKPEKGTKQYKEFRARINARNRERWASDPEFRARMKAHSRKWRLAHREAFNAYHREYWAKRRAAAKAAVSPCTEVVSSTERKMLDLAVARLEAKRESRRRWYQKNKAKVAAYNKKWREANKEHIAVRTRIWREKNPEKVKAYAAKWSANNPAKVEALRKRKVINSKAWHLRNRDYHNTYNRISKRKADAIERCDFIAAREYDTALRVLSDDLAKIHNRLQRLRK